MNIFVLHTEPDKAARQMCDKHVPKMIVESAQMMASAVRRYGATDEQFIEHGILTKAGKPYRGGYKNHPCTIWAGNTSSNFAWLALHGLGLCAEYTKRFGKIHACESAIKHMIRMVDKIPAGITEPFALAMDDEYKQENAVEAYRNYYFSKRESKGGVRYNRTTAPLWWKERERECSWS